MLTNFITWNCNRGWPKKAPALSLFPPGVACVQEANTPDGLLTLNCGVAVDAAPIPGVKVASKSLVYLGGTPVEVVNVWTKNDDYSAYIGQLPLLLDRWAPRGPAVLAGDFNWSPKIDRKYYPSGGRFTPVANRLRELGFVSAYHMINGVDFGDEPDSTYFHTRDLSQPFHHDFVWLRELRPVRAVVVGDGTHPLPDGRGWMKLSDHRPVLVECEL